MRTRTITTPCVLGLLALVLVACAARSEAPGAPVATCTASQAPRVEAAVYAGPIIDTHVHIFFDEALAHSVSRANLAVPASLDGLLADPRYTLGLVNIAMRGNPVATAQMNDQLVALVNKHAGRTFAIGSVHPDDGAQALAELDRLKQLGVKMLKLHPNTQQLDVSSDAVDAVVARCAQLGMPVMFDYSGLLRASDFGKYMMLAIKHPDARLVLAHMGLNRFADTLIWAANKDSTWNHNNIWFDLAATATVLADSPFRDQLVWTLRTVGIDRILFGSDYPVVTPAEAARAVERLGLTEAEMRRVFHDNARELLALP